MLTIRLSNELEERLNHLSSQTGRTKSHYVKQAIQQFLEDEEERLLAISRLEQSSTRMSLEELEKKLGLED